MSGAQFFVLRARRSTFSELLARLRSPDTRGGGGRPPRRVVLVAGAAAAACLLWLHLVIRRLASWYSVSAAADDADAPAPSFWDVALDDATAWNDTLLWNATASALAYAALPYHPMPVPLRPNATARCFRSPLQPHTAAEFSRLLEASVSFLGEGPTAGSKRDVCVGLKAVQPVGAPEHCDPGRLCVRAPAAVSPRQVVQLSLELGYELLAGSPWAYAAALAGDLRLSAGTGDSAPYYFFSGRHCEKPGVERRYRPLVGTGTTWPHADEGPNGRLINALVGPHSFSRPGEMPGWRMPPYHAYFCGHGLLPFAGRRYVFIYNKRNTREWGRAPVNFLSPPTLTALFDALAPTHTVVYHRALPGLFASETRGFASDTEDFAALRQRAVGAYGTDAATDGAPGQRLVLLPYTLRRLARAYASLREGAANASQGTGQRQPSLPDFSANALQLSALADADGYIAVQGGPAYLSLLWGPGKPVVLLQKKGLEVELDAVRWFGKLTGAEVVSTADDDTLLQLVRATFRVPRR